MKSIEQAIGKLQKQGRLSAALEAGLLAAEQYLKDEQVEKAIGMYSICGILLLNLGDTGGAYEYQEKAIDLAEDHDLPLLAARAQINISTVLIINREFSEAVVRIRDSEKIFRELEDEEGLSDALEAIGVVHCRQGYLEESLGCLQEAMKIRKRHGSTGNLLLSASSLSGTLLDMGRPEDALSVCSEILKNAGGSELPQRKADVYLKHAEAELELGKSDQAFGSLAEADLLLNQLEGCFLSKAVHKRLLSKLYAAKGMLELAYDALEDYVRVKKEIQDHSTEEKLLKLRIDAEIKANLKEKAILVENSQKLEETNNSLKEALAHAKMLSGMLPICPSCKKIRNDSGYWEQIEEYLTDHSEAIFSHCLCQECMRLLYPEFSDSSSV